MILLLASYALCQTTPIDDNGNNKDPLLKQPIHQYFRDVQPGSLIFSLGEVLPKRPMYMIPFKMDRNAPLSMTMADKHTPPSETRLIHVDWPIQFM